MYEAFFSLEDPPFVLTPDPRFLLRSKSHHDILSSLLYGITSQKGLMALIGDVGTGKTTLCRALLRELPSAVQSALVLNPHLSDAELVGAVLDDLGLERRGTTKGELMATLSQHVLAAGAEGKTVVVVLDEAQQMSVAALEQIRILSTLETPTRKLLQIVLVGQPELEERLARPELRQLDQRIAIRCYLEPLSKRDTFRYIEHRLRIAGLPGELPFTRTAMNRIYQYSRGIPRVINLACDRALMAAFSARAREIGPSLVRAAVKNLEGERHRRRRAALRPARRGRRRWPAALVAALAGLAIVGFGALVYRSDGMWWSALASRLAAATSREAPSPAPDSAGDAGVPKPAGGVVDAGVVAAAQPQREAPGGLPPSPAGASAGALSGLGPPRHSEMAAAMRPGSPPQEGVKGLLVQLLRLWGVGDGLAEDAVKAWPVSADGIPLVEAVADRYQLSATFLPNTSLGDLRAIGLPALVELVERQGKRLHVLRRIDGRTLTLLTPGGDETQVPADRFQSAWTHSAWVIWRNIDQLPADPQQVMSPTVLATLSLRLQKLGHLPSPLPATYGERFEEGVRRFQRAAGLPDDGIVGPRTTLALARVVSGPFGPSIVERPTR